MIYVILKKKNNTIDLTSEDFDFILLAVAARVALFDESYKNVDCFAEDSDENFMLTNYWISANNIYRKLLTAFAKNENKKVKVIFK